MLSKPSVRSLAVLFALLVVVGTVPGVVAAQETRSGATVVVEEGETVDGLSSFAGNVVVRGTVDGDLSAFAGNVDIEESGQVTGDVSAFAGNVRVHGDVGGDVSTSTGTLLVGPDATIGGGLAGAAGTATLAGTVRGDVELGAGTLTVASTADVGGSLTYDAETFNREEGATIAGPVTRDANLSGVVGPGAEFGVPTGAFAVYGFLVNALLGAVLLLVFPEFSRRLASTASGDPVRSGGVGLLTLIGVPILLALFAVTIVGIPLTILGAFLFAFLIWVGYVYGAFSLGTWGLSLADADNRWLALLVGLAALALLDFVPILGGLLQFVVLLLGLGALVLGLRRWYRARRETAEPTSEPRFDEPAPPGEESGA